MPHLGPGGLPCAGWLVVRVVETKTFIFGTPNRRFFGTRHFRTAESCVFKLNPNTPHISTSVGIAYEHTTLSRSQMVCSANGVNVSVYQPVQLTVQRATLILVIFESDIVEISPQLISNHLGGKFYQQRLSYSVRDDRLCSGNFTRQPPGPIGPIAWTLS